MSAQPKFDEIGYWSEVKLDIVVSTRAYSRIIDAARASHVYIDGFAGAGVHVRRPPASTSPGAR